MFQEIMVKNTPNLLKTINAHDQEFQQIGCNINTHKHKQKENTEAQHNQITENQWQRKSSRHPEIKSMEWN